LKRVRPTHSKRGRGHNNSNGNTIPSSSQKIEKHIVCDELLSISDDDLSFGSAETVYGSDVSSVDVTDSEYSSLNDSSANKVDSSAKERPDYRIKANGKMTLRGKVCGLLTRIGTKLKHSDVPKGTTDKKSCSSVPEAFRDYKNEDPKQTKICHWCEDSCVSNSAPSTSQASVPVTLTPLGQSKCGRRWLFRNRVAPSDEETSTAYGGVLSSRNDELLFEREEAVRGTDVRTVLPVVSTPFLSLERPRGRRGNRESLRWETKRERGLGGEYMPRRNTVHELAPRSGNNREPGFRNSLHSFDPTYRRDHSYGDREKRIVALFEPIPENRR
jgi:hypothetical protein